MFFTNYTNKERRRSCWVRKGGTKYGNVNTNVYTTMIFSHIYFIYGYKRKVIKYQSKSIKLKLGGSFKNNLPYSIPRPKSSKNNLSVNTLPLKSDLWTNLFKSSHMTFSLNHFIKKFGCKRYNVESRVVHYLRLDVCVGSYGRKRLHGYSVGLSFRGNVRFPVEE